MRMLCLLLPATDISAQHKHPTTPPCPNAQLHLSSSVQSAAAPVCVRSTHRRLTTTNLQERLAMAGIRVTVRARVRNGCSLFAHGRAEAPPTPPHPPKPPCAAPRQRGGPACGPVWPRIAHRGVRRGGEEKARSRCALHGGCAEEKGTFTANPQTPSCLRRQASRGRDLGANHPGSLPAQG